jgi:hypothetical protein
VLEDQLVTHLKADTTVTAIAGTRIYDFGSVPQSVTLPHITYQLVANNRIGMTMSGLAMSWKQHYQIDCWAPQAGSPSGSLVSKQLARVVRTSLNGIALPGEDDVTLVEWDDWRDLPEENWSRREMDFFFWTRDP